MSDVPSYWVWGGWLALFLILEVAGFLRRYVKWIKWKTFSETTWDWEYLLKRGRLWNSWRSFWVLAFLIWLTGHLALGWWH